TQLKDRDKMNRQLEVLVLQQSLLYQRILSNQSPEYLRYLPHPNEIKSKDMVKDLQPQFSDKKNNRRKMIFGMKQYLEQLCHINPYIRKTR
ncbi:MAG: hypothetical protein EZS28_030456, partial [Streblomastix strix]